MLSLLSNFGDIGGHVQFVPAAQVLPIFKPKPWEVQGKGVLGVDPVKGTLVDFVGHPGEGLAGFEGVP